MKDSMKSLVFMAKMMPEEKLLADLLIGIKEYQEGKSKKQPILPLFILFIKWMTEDLSLMEAIALIDGEEEKLAEKKVSPKERILEDLAEDSEIDAEAFNIFKIIFGKS